MLSDIVTVPIVTQCTLYITMQSVQLRGSGCCIAPNILQQRKNSDDIIWVIQ